MSVHHWMLRMRSDIRLQGCLWFLPDPPTLRCKMKKNVSRTDYNTRTTPPTCFERCCGFFNLPFQFYVIRCRRQSQQLNLTAYKWCNHWNSGKLLNTASMIWLVILWIWLSFQSQNLLCRQYDALSTEQTRLKRLNMLTSVVKLKKRHRGGGGRGLQLLLLCCLLCCLLLRIILTGLVEPVWFAVICYQHWFQSFPLGSWVFLSTLKPTDLNSNLIWGTDHRFVGK